MLKPDSETDQDARAIQVLEVRVRHLYISPGHNFRGHHGREPGTHEAIEVESIECVAGRGLEGDRYFDHQNDFKGQITFFDWAVFQRLRDALGAPDRQPAALRRNVIVEGIDLNTLIGKQFSIQGILFEGAEECKPCYWMDRAFAPGAEPAMQGCGGLRARILTSGVLRRTPTAADPV